MGDALVLGLSAVGVGLVALLLFPPRSFEPSLDEIRRISTKYSRFLLLFVIAFLLQWEVVFFRPSLLSLLPLGGKSAPLVEPPSFPLPSEAWDVLLLSYVFLPPILLVGVLLVLCLLDDERPAKGVILSSSFVAWIWSVLYLLYPIEIRGGEIGTWRIVLERASPSLIALGLAESQVAHLHLALLVALFRSTRESSLERVRNATLWGVVLILLFDFLLDPRGGWGSVGGLVLGGVGSELALRIVSIRRLVLREVRPRPQEKLEIEKDARDLVDKVRFEAQRIDPRVEVELVGSLAKGTYLRNRVEIDVFVLFPPETPRLEMEEKGLRIGRAVLEETEERYAEHPYVRGRFRGWQADVVPAYRVEDPRRRISSVDRTPFHTRYVRERLTREEEDEVRLLKQFLRGIEIYGADSIHQGFSGYLCELLILKFGTFERVVREASRWRRGVFLTLECVENPPSFSSPLVFLDPTDEKRNAASAVSLESFELFVEACRSFLRHPSLRFFFPRTPIPEPPDSLRRVAQRRGSLPLLVLLPRPSGVLPEALHDQSRKALRAIRDLLERYEFPVHACTFDVTEKEVRLLVETSGEPLPEGRVHVGPPATSRVHSDRFRRRWRDDPEALSEVYEEGGRLKVVRRREFRTPPEVLQAHLSTLDLGKDFQGVEPRIEYGLSTLRAETAPLFTRLYAPRRPWER